MKQQFTLILLLFVTYTLNAQTDSTEKTKPQLKISLNYNSNLNYYGRTDSLRSSGVFPLVEFWATPNFYVNAAPVFVNNAISSFDYAGTIATAGYQVKSEKWLGNVYFLKPFYEEDVQLVQSALKSQTGISLSYLNKFLNVTAGGDVKFSDNTDFGATAGLDHIIRIENKDNSVLVFDPSIYAYAGTQRFTNTYYKNRPGQVLLPNNRERVTETVNRFNILAYEISMPIIYAKNKFMILATPSYVLPQNLVHVPDRPDLTEQGRNMFYATLGVKYSF